MRSPQAAGVDRYGAVAFLAAFATLFSQVLVHRMVQAKLLANFAFLVISLTMLGFAFSGVVLTTRERLREDRDGHLVSWAALFGVALLATSVIFYRLPAAEGMGAGEARVSYLVSFLSCVPFALLFAVPFAFCGLMLGTLLSSPDLPTRRLYCLDLLGSAAGAVLVIPAIRHWGVEASALVIAAGLVGGTALLLRPRRRAPWLLAAASLVAVAIVAARGPQILRMRYPTESVLGQTQLPGSRSVLEHVVWDPIARIEVTRIAPPSLDTFFWPALLGPDRGFHARFQRILTQNNNAFTYAVAYDGRPESLRGIEDTIYAAAYQARAVPSPRVAVIGVGGGFDILTALRFEASSILGVEINEATLGIVQRTYRDYFRSWVDDPRVHLLHGEGRHVLARGTDQYDVLQLSGVDSASGTPGAAHVFSENYLYTAEAFDLYLRRLTPQGILNLMRPEYLPPREMLRALVAAVEALRRSGVARPAEHIVMLASRNGHFTALLVKRTPFTAAEAARLEFWAAGSPFFYVAAAPTASARPANAYQSYLALEGSRQGSAAVRAYPFDIRPVADDRPFFFRYSRWRHLFWPPLPDPFSVPVMELSLCVLLLLTSVVAALVVLVPLRKLAREGLREPRTARQVVFFSGIGLGYLAIEIALLQKFGLLLGHPNYALSVVLAALLCSTGIGSLFSASIVRGLGPPRRVSYVLAGILFLEYFLVLPRLSALVVWPFWARVLLVCGCVLPIGVCLGTFFPHGLETLKATAPRFVPWAWGLNGVFSVISPLLSVALSMTFGMNALLLAAIPVYLVAALALGTAGTGEEASPLGSGG